MYGVRWQPTQVFLLGKSHGQRSLVGYSPWGHRESDATEWPHTHTHTHGVRCRGHDSFFPNRNVCFLHHRYSNGLVFHHLIKLVSFSKLSYSQMSLSLNLLFCSIYLSTIMPRLYCLTILALYMEIFGEIINLTNLFCLIFMCKEMTFGFKKYG